MSNPVQANLIAWQNADFSQSFQFVDENGTPIDFTGSLFEMDIKLTAAGSVSLAAEIDDDDSDQGILRIWWDAGGLGVANYVYDLVRISGATRELLMLGTVEVRQGVTQP